MIRKMKKLISDVEAYFYCRGLIREIGNANLYQLRRIANVFDMHFDKKELSRDQAEELVDVWVQKVLLLVNDFNDVEKMLDSVEQGNFYQPLIRAYGERTTSLNSIVRLLNRLWLGVPKNIPPIYFDEYAYNDLLDTEFVLAKRAKELSAGKYGLGHIAELAGLIKDPVGDGRGSRTSEDIVISLALPKLRLDFMGGMDFVRNFKLHASHYRFLKAFVEANGLTLPSQAIKLTDHILTPKLGGKELAQTILRAVNAAPFDISIGLRLKLEAIIAGEDPLRLFEGGFGSSIGDVLMSSLLDGEVEDDGLPSLESIFAMQDTLEELGRVFPMAGKDSRSGFPSTFSFSPSSGMNFKDVFEGTFGGTETHNHPQAGSFKDSSFRDLFEAIGEQSPDKCLECPRLEGCSLPIAQIVKGIIQGLNPEPDSKLIISTSLDDLHERLEQSLIKVLEAGRIGTILINDQEVGDFLAANPGVISQETRQRIYAALAR